MVSKILKNVKNVAVAFALSISFVFTACSNSESEAKDIAYNELKSRIDNKKALRPYSCELEYDKLGTLKSIDLKSIEIWGEHKNNANITYEIKFVNGSANVLAKVTNFIADGKPEGWKFDSFKCVN